MKKKAAVMSGFCMVFLLGLVLMGGRSTKIAAVAGNATTFLPIIAKPLDPDPDMMVTAVETNQAVQRANNSVPLVTNKAMIVRVYAVSPEEPVNNVVVSLTAHRFGSQIGQMNSAPTTIPQSTSRANPNSSVNFNVPIDWLSSNVTLTAKVDANNSYPREPNEDNNTFVREISFTSVPDLQIKIVPINYTHQGPTRPGSYPAQRVDYISGWIERVYPIADTDITYHSTNYNFQGNLQEESSWLQLACAGNVCEPVGGLLWEMTLLKYAELGHLESPIVYYAFVPTENPFGRWFNSGIAGIGWISGPDCLYCRESVGLNLGLNDQTGSLGGHEIGHNLGRYHAPCGGAGGPDPNFPHAGGSIGEYGIDVPLLTYYTPADATDFMGYCDPSWISDYTYIGLFNEQLLYGHAPEQAPMNSMLISAGLTESGGIGVASTYALDGVPTTETGRGKYFAELLDVSGQVIARHEMQHRVAEEELISGELLLAVVPLPAEPVASVRILSLDGGMSATKSLNSADSVRGMTAVATQENDSITLTWADADTPAIIRYTPDGGQTWQGIGMGVTGGAFSFDAQTLPEGDDGRFEIILADTNSPAILTVEMP